MREKIINEKNIALQKTSRVLVSLLAIFLISLLSCEPFYVTDNDIIKKLNKREDVHYSDAKIKGDLDFTTLEDNTVYTSIEFMNCTFEGNIIAKETLFKQDVTFTGSVIKETHTTLFGEELVGEVDFSMAQITGNANFEQVRFPEPNVHFRNTRFIGNANFDGAQFQDFVWFSRAQFKSPSSFVGTRFKYAVFTGAEFLSGASFEDARFSSTADFYNAKFTNYANFKRTGFSGYVQFTGATLNGEPFKP